jgi:hypothetical protein
VYFFFICHRSRVNQGSRTNYDFTFIHDSLKHLEIEKFVTHEAWGIAKYSVVRMRKNIKSQTLEGYTLLLK